MKYFIFIAIALLGMQSCSTGPRAIRYGEESCAHCKMVISDKRFGAELINTKGKIITFDAAECMLSYLKAGQADIKDIKGYYVADATEQGTMIEARQAHYAIGELIRSPMGGNIAAARTPEAVQKLATEFSARILSWEQLLQHSGVETAVNIH
jgi:copper chaperone NosL